MQPLITILIFMAFSFANVFAESTVPAKAMGTLLTPVSNEEFDLSTNQPLPVMVAIDDIVGLHGFDKKRFTNCFSFAASVADNTTDRINLSVLSLSCDDATKGSRITTNMRGIAIDGDSIKGLRRSDGPGDIIRKGYKFKIYFAAGSKIPW